MPNVMLPVDVRSVRTARSILRQTLDHYGTRTRRVARGDTAGNAALMVSELVTNAVRHTRGLLVLEISIRDHTLFVAVDDDGHGLPILREVDHHAGGGRGLKIVDVLADRWGVIPGPGRKTVWFEVALP